MTLPYEGVRILDFTQLEQGPLATQILADFGAEVIKVERPAVGEIGRRQAPFHQGVSCFWAADNRNKRSLSVDVKSIDGKGILLRLAAVADVVVSNFRPGVMERLGLGYQHLSKVNPRIICAYGSGYGRTGPYRDRRGQDLAGQALGGLMALTGESGGPPTAVGTPIVDFIAGQLLAQGIMAALAARERTGVGQEVDVSLLDAAVASHLQEGTAYLNTGRRYLRQRRGISHAYSGALYGTYQTSDGAWLFLVGSFVDRPWKRVCAAVGIVGAVSEDPRYETREGQIEYEATLRALLEEAFSRLTREEAVRRLEAEELLCGPVLEHADVFQDPQVLHNQMILETDHPTAGPLKLVGIPVKLSGTPGRLRRPPPTLGQHNEEILREIGYSDEEIRCLRDRGAVGVEAAARETAGTVG